MQETVNGYPEISDGFWIVIRSSSECAKLAASRFDGAAERRRAAEVLDAGQATLYFP